MTRCSRVATGVGFVGLLFLSACVADDSETTTFSASDEQVLPAATSPTTAAESESESDSVDITDSDDESNSGTDDEPGEVEATTTTEPLDPLLGLASELITDGFDQPILVTSAPGTDAMFVVERKGLIKIVTDGQVAPEPFLDLSSNLLSNSIEQGLLGLAFHPEYAKNGRFFAYWTNEDLSSNLVEFSAKDPTTASTDDFKVLLRIEQPAERHNAGMIAFGPEGLLYLSLGDGGSGGEPAQDTSNLLGSIVRVDVDNGDPYAIPDTNPMDTEMWVYGLRNPWRFAIDPVEELVYIGDVGQDVYEEINIVPLGAEGAGTNFGWSQVEGTECFRSGCNIDDFTAPALQYTHDEGCSVSGGVVYRGSVIPELNGHFFYADWCGDLIRSFRYDNGKVVDQLDWTEDLGALGQVTSFGTDHDNEMYAVNWDGELHKIAASR